MNWKRVLDAVKGNKLTVLDLGVLSYLSWNSDKIGRWDGSASELSRSLRIKIHVARGSLRRLREFGALRWSEHDRNKTTRRIYILTKRRIGK